ncbi:MAG: winged helix-turn-helix transcriptional regulator [Candidatus Thorarchaeota archaeon]|nr:winged helix-turn-helix transcriptional regulator [Candidatus Thorarchaeota archaeon]
MSMRRAVVLVSLVLAMTGLLAVLTIEDQLGHNALIIQDLSFSGSLSNPVETFGMSLGIGTMAVVQGGTTGFHSMALSGIPLVLGTVAVEKRSEKQTSLRCRIVNEISENPGIHLRELLRNVGCAMGALQYHLKNLEQAGVVVSIRNGNSKHFFMADFSSNPQVMQLAALLRNPTIHAIIDECKANGRVTQAHLSRMLSIDKSLISYYATALIDSGFLKIIPVFGRERPLTLTDYALSALGELGVS